MTGAILALIFAITLSNLGIIPVNAPVWDAVWEYVVPLAIPLLLLQCDMKKIGKEAGRILILFLIGSIGTALGSVLGYILLKDAIPELAALAGIFTGTYIGGTVNFAALGAAFEVSGESTLNIGEISGNAVSFAEGTTLVDSYVNYTGSANTVLDGITFAGDNYIKSASYTTGGCTITVAEGATIVIPEGKTSTVFSDDWP